MRTLWPKTEIAKMLGKKSDEYVPNKFGKVSSICFSIGNYLTFKQVKYGTQGCGLLSKTLVKS